MSASTAARLSNDRNAAHVLAELEITGLLVGRVPATADDVAGEAVPPDEVDRPSEADPSYLIHPLLAEVVRRLLSVDGVDVARARAAVVRAVRLDLAGGHASRSLSRLLRVNALGAAADVLARSGVLHGAEPWEWRRGRGVRPSPPGDDRGASRHLVPGRSGTLAGQRHRGCSPLGGPHRPRVDGRRDRLHGLSPWLPAPGPDRGRPDDVRRTADTDLGRTGRLRTTVARSPGSRAHPRGHGPRQARGARTAGSGGEIRR